jgi:transcription elongation factor Elf1
MLLPVNRKERMKEKLTCPNCGREGEPKLIPTMPPYFNCPECDFSTWDRTDYLPGPLVSQQYPDFRQVIHWRHR